MIKSYHIIRIVFSFSLFLFVILGTVTLIPIYNNIDNAEATAGTATASTLTFTSTRSTASVNLTVGDSNGTFATSGDGINGTNEERAVFSIATNNYTGYTLSLKSSTNTTTLSNANGTISTLLSPTTLSTFSADTSEGRALNNRWGYIPNYYNATGTSPVQNTTTYYPAPTTSGTTLRTTTSRNSANGEDNPDNYTIGLGLRADFTNPTGTYTNDSFILELVANPVAYTITYADNTSDSSVSGIPAVQSGATTGTGASSTSAESITLSNATPTRTGYTFSGWCLGTVANSGTTCNGTTTPTYTKGASFGIDKTTGNNITLYATWTINTFTITKKYKLQDATGNYPSSYTDDGTVTVNYGDSYTYTINATTTHQAASQTVSNVTSTQTISLDVPRNTVTVSLTSGTGISAVAVTGTGVKTGSGTASATVYYGGAVTISATLTSGYDWVNWTGSATYTNQSQSISNVTSNLSFTANGKMDPCKNKTSLYDLVSCRSKGTQTAADFQAAITTANSGVYEYNASLFGTASDAANTSKIYYYRGILDETVGSYGSDGDGKAWPNYVILQAGSSKVTTDTCWRIVRTTGSGGVKMIYNGKWTGSTCANAQTNAQVTTQAFGLQGNSAQSTYWYRNINRVGYTFNNTQSLQDSTTSTSVDTVFGSDSSPSTNNERSNIKKYIEDTWYASNMTSWTSKLEASAGYCNDRTAFSDKTGATALTTIPPYATSSADMYFGAYARNYNSAKAPSLSCPRSTVDLYRYVSGSTGVSNQLKYPVALITADEASFAGSGSYTATDGSSYNANSYLRSGSNFWLLSPISRVSNGYAVGFILNSSGTLNSYYVNGTYGVRPAISLVSGTTISSGSGIATDPWVVIAPTSPGCFIAGSQVMVSLNGDTKAIEDIKTGDSVVSYDRDADTYYMTEVVDTFVHPKSDNITKLVDMELEDGTVITMTPNHPILTTDGFKAVDNKEYSVLTKQDIVKTMDGYSKIVSLRSYDVEPTVVYNMNVKGFDEAIDDDVNDTYIVNGVIVHNATTGAAVKP